MTKTVNTFKKDLMSLDVGSEPLNYKKKLHRSYLSTASKLKKDGFGEWHCECNKYDKVGKAYRVR